jgi:hypothetical protein
MSCDPSLYPRLYRGSVIDHEIRDTVTGEVYSAGHSSIAHAPPEQLQPYYGSYQLSYPAFELNHQASHTPCQ